MSEQPQPVLLDSTTYFRLGISIHPLLHGSFGTAPKYTLCVHADLDDEYRRSSRLKNKFEWVSHAEYVDDRKGKRYEVPRKLRKQADDAFTFLAAYEKEHGLNLSLVDLKALAVGFVMGIPLVTDDVNMRRVADEHSIECWNTIQLLKLMVTANRISMDKVTEILGYLNDQNDLPMAKPRLRELFREYFGTDCPI